MSSLGSPRVLTPHCSHAVMAAATTATAHKPPPPHVHHHHHNHHTVYTRRMQPQYPRACKQSHPHSSHGIVKRTHKVMSALAVMASRYAFDGSASFCPLSVNTHRSCKSVAMAIADAGADASLGSNASTNPSTA
jgi:hypothetical protein